MPRVTYVDIPYVYLVTLLIRGIIVTWHVNWIVFVHMTVEGTRVMIVMNVAGGFYDYASFLISQDKTYLRGRSCK